MRIATANKDKALNKSLLRTESDTPSKRGAASDFLIRKPFGNLSLKIPLIVKNSPLIDKTGFPNLDTMMIIMDQLPVEQKRSGIVVVGGESSLHYLLQRYAGRAGYPVSVEKSPSSVAAIRQSEPVAVIFPSIEILEGAQALAAELANCDIPIIVFSTVLDQAKTRALGADYCLLHPLEFDSFSSTLNTIVTLQQENRPVTGEEQDTFPINPV